MRGGKGQTYFHIRKNKVNKERKIQLHKVGVNGPLGFVHEVLMEIQGEINELKVKEL